MKQDKKTTKKEVVSAEKPLMTQRQIDDVTDLTRFQALKLLQENNLLYFRVLSKMNFITDPNFQSLGAVGFNKKNNRIYMIIKEEALLKGTKEDVAGLFEHECGHVLFEHIFDFKPGRDHQLMNVAQDLIINDSCHYITSRIGEITAKDSTSILKDGCFYPKFQEKYPKLKDLNSEDLTSLQLYNILKEEQDKNCDGKGNKKQSGKGAKGKGAPGGSGDDAQQKGDGGSGEEKGEGQGFDSHDQFEIKEDADGNEVVEKTKETPEQQAEIASAAKDALVQALESLKREGELNKAIGQLSGKMQLLVQDMIKSKTDKNSIFKFLNRVVVGEKKKWTKLHRRYPYLAKGRRKNKKPNLVMVIDTSGSMGGDTLFGMIKFQCQGLVKRCKKLWIVVGDTQMEYSVFIKNQHQFKPETIEFRGGGGTNMQFGWDFAKEHKLDGVIVHTDGYIPEFDDHGIKTIFYLYGPSSPIEGYQNVQVFPE